MTVLEVRNIHAFYGLSQVLFGVSFEVAPGEVVALLGRNGVGKTTTMRSISGLLAPRRGQVRWRGRDMAGLPAHRIARMGVGYVPEERRIFADLTVWENLDMGRRPAADGSAWSERQVYELFPELEDMAARPGGVLSGGQQQMLAIGRSLMGNPGLLLLDQPSEGLAPRVVEALGAQVKKLKEMGLAILVAEQNLRFALDLSDRVHILEKGEIKFSGTPDELRGKGEILEKYLAL